MALYRFKVLEAFKGLPPGTQEVFIDPASMSPCQNSFAHDRDYLVYTGGTQPPPAAVTIFRNKELKLAKPFPPTWKGLEQLPVFSVPQCNPTRAIKETDSDLTFLRSSGKDQGDGWIEGWAVQNFTWTGGFPNFVAATDAVFTVTSPSGRRSTTVVQPDGTFKIGPVAPGVYAISVQSPVLGRGQLLPKPQLEVPRGGCAVARASFETQATISGKVLDAQGKQAQGIRVELGEIVSGGKVRRIPMTWTNTDRDGNFKVPNAPVGRIVLAANLNGAPTVDMPFDPVYVANTQDISKARVYAIQPGKPITGILLQLPKPLLFGDLYVDVKWPDGSPALGGARAFADWKEARADFEHAPNSSNRVKLRLALKRKYDIHVDWIDPKPERFLFVDGAAPSTIDFTDDGQRLELRLKAAHPR